MNPGRRTGLEPLWLAASALCLATSAPAVALDSSRPASQYTVDHWREGNGLPQSYVYTITQTRNGYLWLGTRRGLARFDGIRFTSFDDRQPNQLRDSEVRALAEDDDGSLWVATHGGGLSHLRDGTFTSYSVEEGLPSDTITSLRKAPHGPLWIGSTAGLTAFDGRHFKTYTAVDGLPGTSINTLHMDAAGTLWVGTDGGLASFANGKLVNHASLDPALAGSVAAIVGDSRQGLWLGRSAARSQGLQLLKDGVVTRFGTKDGLLSDSVTALLLDGHGVLWIGTAAGLCRLRDGRVDPLERDTVSGGRQPAVTSLGAVQSLHMDVEGSLWVGTRYDGLARLKNALFSNVLAGGTSSIIEDRAGAMWVAGAEGVARIRDGATSVYKMPLSGIAYSLAQDDGDRIWVGTSDGPFWTHSGRLEPVAAASLRGVALSVLLPDGSGNMWMGGRSTGLYLWRDGVVTHYTPNEGLGGTEVRALARDSRGALWIGTKDGGLSRFHEGRFTVFGTRQGLPSVAVSAVLVDGRDDVWAATRRGLVRVRGDLLATVTAQQGLPANFFYQILQDGPDVWLTFGSGIARVSADELNRVADGGARALHATVFGAESGIRSTAMTVSFQPTAWRTRDGQLWFASGDGVAVLDPRSQPRNDLPPPVHIEEVLADGRPRPVGGGVDVAPGRGDLEVRYTALSFLAPETVRFKYRLDGFDRDWVDADTRRVAYYTNIPPGGYRFRVTACNNDGVWNETGAAIDVHLSAHFYQTVWFYGACALGLALAGAATQRLRLRRSLDRERELSSRVDEAVAQIRVLGGLLPICASCKKIRDDKGYWNQMETYIHEHSEAVFTHGICPECTERLYPATRKSDDSRPAGLVVK